MRAFLLISVAVAGCQFTGRGDATGDGAVNDAPVTDGPPADARRDARIPDADPPDANQIDAVVPAVCGNGVVEPGEDCELGNVTACATSCGDTGTMACTSSCGFAPCTIVVDPAADWEVSTNGTTGWAAVTLPHTNWPCDNCTRHYRTEVCDVPSAVTFRWSSDNSARMSVNGTLTFDTYWQPNYCTDATCCTKCCDNPTNCVNRLSPVQALDAGDLLLFDAGPNTLRWEVHEEVGGSGFHTVMTVEY